MYKYLLTELVRVIALDKTYCRRKKVQHHCGRTKQHIIYVWVQTAIDIAFETIMHVIIATAIKVVTSIIQKLFVHFNLAKYN